MHHTVKLMRKFVAAFGALAFTLVFGYLLGRHAAVRATYADAGEISFLTDTRTGAPTVVFEGIVDGLLRGAVRGDVRVFIDTDHIETDANGFFAVDPGALRTNVITIHVPDDAEFVASVRGTRYYPVFSSAGEKIVPRNRVYFANEDEAEAAGFTAGN